MLWLNYAEGVDQSWIAMAMLLLLFGLAHDRMFQVVLLYWGFFFTGGEMQCQTLNPLLNA
jgi:hypothetical protein